MQDEYYRNLYQMQNIEIDEEYFDDIQIPKMSNKDRQDLEKEITEQEVTKALWAMKLDKVMGMAGLPPEFYRHFWNEIKGLVTKVIQTAAKEGFGLGSRRSIISLIEKPGKSMLKIPAWRPLSLLNTDYKILSKILATRIEKIMPKLIHVDQMGFTKGCSLSDNVIELLAAIEHCEKEDIPALLVNVDFMKAFDCVEYNILYHILRKFNFGKNCISMIQNLYKDIEICTINCGFTADYFKISRGLRQGCRFSAPVFLYYVEIIGLKLRQDKNLQGIRIKEKAKKHAQYADNLWALIHATQENFNRLVKHFELFEKNTGLKINYDKTQIVRIGSLRKSETKFYADKPLHWSDKTKVLGIEVNANRKVMIESNFKMLLQKMEKILNDWGFRTLTLIGKIAVVNTLVVSMTTQKLTILPN